MYRVHHRLRHHYLRFAAVLLVAGLLVAGSVLAVRTFLQPHTALRQSPAVTRHVAASAQPMQHIAKDFLTFDLPTGWVATEPPNIAYKVYSWRGGINTDDAARRIDMYIDTAPATLAANRLLPVQASGDHLEVLGTTSDNCVNFTDKMPDTTSTGRASSKWAGVSFWCDMANYERDVVAIGSAEGVNTITLTGRTAGSHRVLLVYTDNSAGPDYSLFGAIIKSLLVI